MPICEKLKDSATAIKGKYPVNMKLQDKYINRIVKGNAIAIWRIQSTTNSTR